MDPIIEGIGNEMLSQGLLGTIVIALIYWILKRDKEISDLRQAHKVELASKDALINQLHEERIKEIRVGYDIARSNQSTLDAFLAAIRGKDVK